MPKRSRNRNKNRTKQASGQITHKGDLLTRRCYIAYQEMKCLPGASADRRVVSLLGGKDSALDARCISLYDANHADALKNDMLRNQWFRITKVEIKLIFAPVTDSSHSANSIRMGASRFEIIRPDIDIERIYALQDFDVYSVPTAINNMQKSYNPTVAQRQFGIDWCPTSEWSDFGAHTDLYMKQLTAGKGGSVFIEVTRNTNVISGDSGDYCQILVRYHIEYRGPKGEGDLS